jgi:hypothetical protein
MDYPHSVENVGLVGGKFTNGNPLLGQAASLDPAEWANAVTDELLNVITAAGLEPDEGSHTQLLQAINALGLEEASAADLVALTDSKKKMTARRVLGAIRSDASMATELLRGVLRIATQAEVGAGALDGVAVTPKKLRHGFSISLAQNGYIIFPSWMDGLIIQWMYATSNAGNNTDITFALAFPTACLHVQVSDNANQAGNVDKVSIDSTTLTKTGVKLRTDLTTGFGNCWLLAIGH